MGQFVQRICLFALCLITSKALAADEWWEYGHFYQIYPRSFQDSDGDGVGDLNGITSRLPYLKEIGVTGAWMSPIFKSPMADFGYDISDFKKIDPLFGTMDDFDRLIARAKELDIKIVLDFVPNHCSDEHEWFKKSSNPNDPEYETYKDYFVWNKGKLLENGTRLPPSNWLSVFRGSSWTWSESRQEFYLHQFLASQPDLNFRNEAVSNEMKEVLRFWLRKGADGFRIDAAQFLVESTENADGLYNDEPPSGNYKEDPLHYDFLDHTESRDMNETYELVLEWRRVMDEPEFSSHTRILMIESYASLENTMKYFGKVKDGEIIEYSAQIPFNFQLMGMNAGIKSYQIKNSIDYFLNNLPKGNKIHANWVLGNHDQSRIATIFGQRRVDLFNILLKTLPGITITYNGEEIGMSDVFVPKDKIKDPKALQAPGVGPEDIGKSYNRDETRSPFQWDDSRNSGFSNASTTWLPVAHNYTINNVQLQQSQRVSHLQVFKDLITLRENPTMKYGAFDIIVIGDDVIVYKRQMKTQKESDVFVVILNLGSSDRIVAPQRLFNDSIPQNMRVAVASIHSQSLTSGTVVDTRNVGIPAEVGVVLTAKYSRNL